MKGLPNPVKSPNCFRGITYRSILGALCFYCSFSTPTKPTEYSNEHEKPFKHVPTHAASSFLRTTTSSAMQRAPESALDHIALGDLDPGLAETVHDEGLAELTVTDGRVINEIVRVGSAEDEHQPEVAASNERHPDQGATDETVRDRDALNETVPEVSSAEVVSITGETEILPPHEGCSDIGPPQVSPTELILSG
jgi:hypothetical protein